MTTRGKWLWMAPAAIAGLMVFGFFGGEAVKLLWNWLVPSIIGWRQVTFWEAVGLLALCRILFGSHSLNRGGMDDRRAERRERFRAAMREQFGFERRAPGADQR